MNSKKLLKTLLWSLAGFTMVLTGCTTTGKDSSSSNKTSTSNSASNSQSTSTSSSGNTSTSTPGPIDPETDTFMLDKAGLLNYSHGQYFKQGEKIGRFGFYVKKKK